MFIRKSKFFLMAGIAALCISCSDDSNSLNASDAGKDDGKIADTIIPKNPNIERRQNRRYNHPQKSEHRNRKWSHLRNQRHFFLQRRRHGANPFWRCL